MTIHKDSEILAVAKVMADKVIEFSDRCKAGEDLEKAEMCLALDDLADLARMVTPDLSGYNPEEDDNSFGC